MNLIGASKIFLKRNSSTILTCFGAIGVVATSVMAVKATPKAMRLLEKSEEEKGEELTKLEKLRIAWPAYIPAALTGLSSIACIFGANALSKRKQASLMSAYALLDNSYKEYKKRTNELLGEDSDNLVKSKIAKAAYENLNFTVDNEKQLFFDFFSLRYFESTNEKVLYAEESLNELLKIRGYVSLNDFYEMLDLAPYDFGYELGWCYDEDFSIKFNHEKVLVDNDLECCIISMDTEPSAMCSF